MERIKLITSKEYWVETLEALQKQGHTDYDIANVIVNKMEEAINYSQCSTQLKDKYVPTFDEWLKDNKQTTDKYGFIIDKRGNEYFKKDIENMYKNKYDL